MTEPASNNRFWTNPSVRILAGEEDAIAKITEEAKSLVFQAIEAGWQGPPFDPFWLAKYRHLSVVPRDDIPDARLVSSTNGVSTIEYNPSQPPARIRFSVAHEIAHTLFPDYRDVTRNRLQMSQARQDEWQQDLLCNVAAAELLMPAGLMTGELNGEIDIGKLSLLWKQFGVSPEAFLIRTARLTNQPVSIFAAARSGDESSSKYRIDYCIPAGSSRIRIPSGLQITHSVLGDCTAIGYTARGNEIWNALHVTVECIGIPPYPGRIFPRVIGVIRMRDYLSVEPMRMDIVTGDVTEPRGSGNRIIAHIVNDKSSTWGAGAARSIANRWSQAHSDFKNWSIARKAEFELGAVHQFEVSRGLFLASMVAQHGYGESSRPRIRYGALRKCLLQVAKTAVELDASVHMPRIGTGFGGGNWNVIEELIRETLTARGVKVTVYELPRTRERSQSFLDSSLDSSITR